MRSVLAALLLSVAAPALADTPVRAAVLVDAMRENGCAMTDAEAEAVLPGLGLGADEVQAAVSALYPAGLVDLSEDGAALVLSGGLCAAGGDEALALITAAFDAAPVLEPWAPAITAEQGAALIGALRDNGCALAEDAAAEVLPALGLGMAETRDAVAVLMQAGVVDLSADGATLSLSGEVCAADAADDATLTDQALRDFAALPQIAPDAGPLEVLTEHLGLDGIRALTGLYAEVSGCTIALEDRAAAETEVADFITEELTVMFNFVPDWPGEARAELISLVAATLDEPGPDFTRAGNLLTLTNCTP
ncbi:MAG TPA: hypothetical protein GX700_01300 [Paracoccus sp.]|nr:hypothetical protein [Paracoccus sp. (in: a-proteobacteria)]